MDYKITGYEPAQLFHFFEEVSAIPRGSGNEKGISDFLVAFAKARGLDAIVIAQHRQQRRQTDHIQAGPIMPGHLRQRQRRRRIHPAHSARP